MQRYMKYSGNLENWIKSQTQGLDETLSGEEWNQIDKVIQRLRLQVNGNASLDYRNETERVMKRLFESEEVIKMARGHKLYGQ